VQKKQLLEMIFADDIAICATSEQELQTIISVFYYTFKEFGLQMNLKKTEILHQKSSTEHENKEASNIEIEGKELLVVSEFKYLGTLISDKATLDVEIQARINKATTAFWKLYQRVWKKKAPHTSHKSTNIQNNDLTLPNLRLRKLGMDSKAHT